MVTLRTIGQHEIELNEFQSIKDVCHQTVGRFNFSDPQGVKIGTAHAVKLDPYTPLSVLLKIPFLRQLLINVLYGDYTYTTFKKDDFLLSNLSVKSSFLQNKVIRQIDQVTTQFITKEKVDALRDHLLKNKEPFRQIAHDESKMYRGNVPIDSKLLPFALTIKQGLPELLANPEYISRGGFKRVFKAVNITHDKNEALLNFNYIPIKGEFLAQREFSFYQTLKARGIEDVLGMDTLQYDMEGNLVGIMPFCDDGDFDHKLNKMTHKEKLNTLISLAEAIAKLHEAGLVHRDIKPQNILMHNGRACLADFGLTEWTGNVNFNGGTRQYMPPELRDKLSPIGYVASAQDAYAFGVMIADCFQWEEKRDESLYQLHSALTHADPNQRMTVRQAHKKLLEISMK